MFEGGALYRYVFDANYTSPEEDRRFNKYDLALLKAADSGDEQCVKLLLLNAEVFVSKAFENGETAVMAAARGGHIGCLKLLINAGTDVNMFDKYGKTALMTAAKNGHVECLNMLIKAGADVNFRNEWNKTALVYAVENEKQDSLEALVHAGADVNAGEEYFALLYAAENGDCDLIDLLLEAGADVNKISSNNTTALLEAALCGKDQSVRRLIEAGADMSFKVLMLAAVYGQYKCMSVLIELGADVNTELGADVNTELGADVNTELGADDRSMNIAGEEGGTALSRCNGSNAVVVLLRAGARINTGSKSAIDFRIQLQLDQKEQTIASDEEKLKECMLLYAAGERFDASILTTEQNDWLSAANVSQEYPLPPAPTNTSLKHLCREAVRNHLLLLDPHSHLFGRVQVLPLPGSLISYLVYDLVLDIDPTSVIKTPFPFKGCVLQ